MLTTTNTFLTLPSSLRQQATWLYDLGMCQLEAGMPEAAAESLSKALTLAPDLGIRPIAAYYLEKIGKPVPPPSKSATPRGTTPETPQDVLKRDILPTIGQPLGTSKPAESKKAAAPAETAKDSKPPESKTVVPAEPASKPK